MVPSLMRASVQRPGRVSGRRHARCPPSTNCVSSRQHSSFARTQMYSIWQPKTSVMPASHHDRSILGRPHSPGAPPCCPSLLLSGDGDGRSRLSGQGLLRRTAQPPQWSFSIPHTGYYPRSCSSSSPHTPPQPVGPPNGVDSVRPCVGLSAYR